MGHPVTITCDYTFFGCSDSRETAVVSLLQSELIPPAEPVVLVALGEGAAVGQDEVGAQVGDDAAVAARPVGLQLPVEIVVGCGLGMLVGLFVLLAHNSTD